MIRREATFTRPGRPMDPQRSIYLDHAATSPLRPAVWEAMGEAVGSADYNPASQHGPGRAAGDLLESARRSLADALAVPRGRVAFTGGGTASDNLAVLGFARSHADRDPVILVSAVEHKAVLRAAGRARREGADVRRIPVDRHGVVELDALEDLLEGAGNRPVLVSLMWANNEVGTIQPVAEAAALARDRGARIHSDAVQAFGKLELSVPDAGVHLLSATAHKLGGPGGIGLLVVHESVELEPLVVGGTQEDGLWPGTQNPVAAAGFARAVELALGERRESASRWRQLRERLTGSLEDSLPGLRIRGRGAPRRLPHVLNVGVPGVDQSALLVSLDMEGVAVSSGSACASGAVEPSHVLEAMGEPGPDRVATVRFSFGPDTSTEDVDRAGEALARVVARLREGSGSPPRPGPAPAAP